MLIYRAVRRAEGLIPAAVTEAEAFFTRMAGLGDTVPDAYKPLYSRMIYALTTQKGRDETNFMWTSFDFLRIEASYSKNVALRNIISSSFDGTIVNDHGASFTANQGLKGNGTNFRVDTGFNPSTATKFTQNSASVILFVLDDKTGDNNQDYAAIKTGGSDGTFIRIKRGSADHYIADGDINNSLLTTPWAINLSGRGWYTFDRNASGASLMNYNGWRVMQINSTSTARANVQMVEFAASVNGTISSWSSQTHAVFAAGNGNIEPAAFISIINRYFIYPLLNSTSTIKNRVHFIGDSMTGDDAAANALLSENSEYCRRTLSNLGSDWQGSQFGDASREVGTTDTVPSLLSLMTAYVTGYVAGQQGTMKRFDVLKDVIVFNIGTNDLAFTGSSTGTQLKADLFNCYDQVKALNYRVVTVGISDRDGTWLSGQTKAGFDLARADMRTLMLAEYNIATAVTNVTANVRGDLYIDVFADSKYTNASNGTYYKADKVHWQIALFDDLADTYLTPAIQLF